MPELLSGRPPCPVCGRPETEARKFAVPTTPVENPNRLMPGQPAFLPAFFTSEVCCACADKAFIWIARKARDELPDPMVVQVCKDGKGGG